MREFVKANVTPAEGIRIAAEHGWASFSADWIGPDGGDRRGAAQRTGNKQAATEERNRSTAQRWADKGSNDGRE
jgi:hypothetical protein